jgi:transposase
VAADSERAVVESLAGVQVGHSTGEKTLVVIASDLVRIGSDRLFCRRWFRQRDQGWIGRWDRIDLDLAGTFLLPLDLTQARYDIEVVRL